ncbi:MAG: hypothetical protein QXG39_03310 [Candidatus Aenigmatarchaeota archaeon]
MNEEVNVLRKLIEGLSEMKKHNFWLLLRSDNFTPVGIVTAKKVKQDRGKGVYRMFAEGFVLEKDALEKGKTFSEPIDRWNPATGRFETIILAENDQGIMITARRSPSVDDDNDDNFLYLSDPYEIREKINIRRELEKRDAIISSMKNTLAEKDRLVEYWENEARTAGEELRRMREINRRLSMELSILKAEYEQMRRYAMTAEALQIQIESAVTKILEDAREKGLEMASEPLERAIASARKLRALKEELSPLETAPLGEEEIRRRIGSVEEKIEEIRSLLAGALEKKKETGKKAGEGGE